MTSSLLTAASLPLFCVVWNQKMGQTTPALHLKMARWLEGAWMRGQKRLLLQAFRASGKSTVTGLFCAWLLYSNPNLRILVLAADQTLARKMVRNVRRILERHPLTTHLRPGNPDEWAGGRFTVRRDSELRDPSMLARGITANITGSRADVIICDDVEVPNTCDTAEKRENLRENLMEIDFILVPDGTQLYIGTPHTEDSIYREDTKDDTEPFLDGFQRLTIPVLDAKGKSAWPERYSLKAIEQMRRRSGPNKFAAQMMLKPVRLKESRLNPDLLEVYDDNLHYVSELKTLFIGNAKIVSASAWWDPSFGSVKGDNSVLAVVYTDTEGNYYLNRIEYIQNKDGSGEDEATRQCHQISVIAKESWCPSVTIETNGIGKFLPTILRNQLAKNRVPCAVKEVSQRRPKDLRILEAFDVVLAARRLFVHKDVLKTPFLQEMRDWQPGRSNARDDGLDAAAGALSQEPVRIKRIYGKGAYTWKHGQPPYQGQTHFDI